ncbi:hypothetical protein Taro_034984 [Colocasia esculenta]|uniref:Nitrate regulatory gene2 protein n=1 Tax=Colocasia esculenta TaxID=4460 RepID=A0A843W968_COLES|nr:hypothetical protein [Colocasia esculenta]
MGGCAASRLGGGGEEEDAVALCRERKRLLKSAVDRRYALAEAHSKYIRSLYSMAGAITLFVVGHSSPTPILITLPPSSSPSSISAASDPSFLRQTPTEPNTEAAALRWSPSPASSSSSSSAISEAGEQEVCEMAGGGMTGNEEAVEVGNAEMGYGCFFSGMPPPPPSPMRSFGWDFFDPFDGVRAAEEAAMLAGLNRSSEEDLRVVREEEGIPELEEVGQQEENGGGEGGEAGKLVAADGGGGDGDVNKGEMVPRAAEDVVAAGREEVREKGEKGLTVVDTPTRERELLDALRDVVDHFIRAYDSGKEVSRMLEASMVHFCPPLEDRKENSSKFIQAITWHRSPSTQSSSSYTSFLASSSKDSSWTESKSDLFDDFGGMASGSHSQTLGRLYAWEKKLYEEVKAGDQIRRIYERKCAQLRSQDAKGVATNSADKTRAVAKDLYTRIWVAVRSAESISQRIQKLRDEELQPQLIELLKGLMDTWRIMLESHETQNQIVFEVKSFMSPAYGKFCTNQHRHASFQLLAELQNWRSCFMSYLTAQKAYVEAIYGWLSKFILPEVEFCSRRRASVPPYRGVGPPMLVICHDWLTSLQKLPDRSVSCAMKCFSRDLRVLCVKQEEEQQQKRKVDNLAKELGKKIFAFQRAENRFLEPKLSELKAETDMRQRAEYLSGRKSVLDEFRERLEGEKAKHHECMQETQRVTLNGFKTGFANIFNALTEFSRDSLKLYNTLVMYKDKTKQTDESRKEAPTITEGSEPETDCR